MTLAIRSQPGYVGLLRTIFDAKRPGHCYVLRLYYMNESLLNGLTRCTLFQRLRCEPGQNTRVTTFETILVIEFLVTRDVLDDEAVWLRSVLHERKAHCSCSALGRSPAVDTKCYGQTLPLIGPCMWRPMTVYAGDLISNRRVPKPAKE